MGSKNAFFKKLKREQEKKSKAVGDLTERWTMQAALDAAIITLGYGDCTKNDPWGAKRLEAFGEEFVDNLLWVISGARYEPDADGVREKVDKLLKKKLPDRFHQWKERYIHWIEDPLEKEADRKRKQWVKDGMNVKSDGGTTELLKGAGRE